jgi:serine/threonine protein kinase
VLRGRVIGRCALATLEHDQIARLYDGGRTDDGIPYLVIELVDGSSIDS